MNKWEGGRREVGRAGGGAGWDGRKRQKTVLEQQLKKFLKNTWKEKRSWQVGKVRPLMTLYFFKYSVLPPLKSKGKQHKWVWQSGDVFILDSGGCISISLWVWCGVWDKEKEIDNTHFWPTLPTTYPISILPYSLPPETKFCLGLQCAMPSLRTVIGPSQ